MNIVFDGNSLIEGVGGKQPISQLILERLSQRGVSVTVSNFGVSGQSWRQMDGLDGGSADEVDAAWLESQLNVLILWETTNSIFNTFRSPEETIRDIESYVNNRLKIHDWMVVILTTIPRQIGGGDQDQINKMNKKLEYCDILIKNNYKNFGVHSVIDIRASEALFNFKDYSEDEFFNTRYLWSEIFGNSIHLNDNGYELISNLIEFEILKIHQRHVKPLKLLNCQDTNVKKIIIILMNCHGLEIQRYLNSISEINEIYDITYIASHVSMNDASASSYVYSKLQCADIVITQNVKNIEWLRNDNIAKHVPKKCQFIRLAFWRFGGFWPINLHRHSENFFFLPVEGGQYENFDDYISQSVSSRLIRDNYEREIDKLMSIDSESDIKMESFFHSSINNTNLFSDYWHPTSIFFKVLIEKILRILSVGAEVELMPNNLINNDRYRFILEAVSSDLKLTFDRTFLHGYDYVMTRNVFYDFSVENKHNFVGPLTSEVGNIFRSWINKKGLGERELSIGALGAASQSSLSQWSAPNDADRALQDVPTAGFCFHTGLDERPWWIVDLGDFRQISKIKVLNRADCPPDLKARAIPLAVSVMTDGAWREIVRINYVFGGGDDNEPLTLDFVVPILARKIKIQVNKVSYLHLNGVKIYSRGLSYIYNITK